MTITIEIMLDDLSEEKQQEILNAYNYKTPEEGNFDIFPITTITIEENQT